MKKKTIIIESIILVVSAVVLALFLGLPQVIDLDKRQNKQKNISQLTELTMNTNNFLDKYKYSMTADLGRLKEKMEYSQKLYVPGDNDYKYFVYGGIKNSDLRYLITYDLLDILNAYPSLSSSNKLKFNNSMNAYLITAKNRLMYSEDSEKYQEFLKAIENLQANLGNTKYFRKAQYLSDIKKSLSKENAALYDNRVSIFLPSLIQSFSNEGKKNLQIGIAFYLAYVNRINSGTDINESFVAFSNDIDELSKYSALKQAASNNVFPEGTSSKDITTIFDNELSNVVLASCNYQDRLNKGIVAIGTNVAENPKDKLSSETVLSYNNTSFQKEINNKLDQLIEQYQGDSDGLENAIAAMVNDYKMNDINNQVVDITESIFNYMQYQDFTYKSIYNSQNSSVGAKFSEKYVDIFHKYLMKYDKQLIIENLAKEMESKKQDALKNYKSRLKNTELLPVLRTQMMNTPDFLNKYYSSKKFKTLVADNEKDFIKNIEREFVNTKKEDLTIENIKANADNDKIIFDDDYLKQLKANKTLWNNQYDYIVYHVTKDNPKASIKGIAAEVIADSTNIIKNNSKLVSSLQDKIAKSKEDYVKKDYSNYNALLYYSDYCTNLIAKNIEITNKAGYDGFIEATTKTADNIITNDEYPEFTDDFLSQVKTAMNEVTKNYIIDEGNIPAELSAQLDQLSAQLTNYDAYLKYVQAKKVSSKKRFSKNELALYSASGIDKNSLVSYYNGNIRYIKGKLDKKDIFRKFYNTQKSLLLSKYNDAKRSATEEDFNKLETQISAFVKANNQDDRANFTNIVSQMLKNYNEYINNDYKFNNAFNFDGLISDLTRVENNIKFYRSLVEFPYYDKDEYYLLYGRFIEPEHDKKAKTYEKIGVSAVVYTDIHNFPQAHKVVVRDLGNTNVDVQSLQSALEAKINSLIQQNRSDSYVHYTDPDYKLTKQEAQAKKDIREKLTTELNKIVDDFVKENY